MYQNAGVLQNVSMEVKSNTPISFAHAWERKHKLNVKITVPHPCTYIDMVLRNELQRMPLVIFEDSSRESKSLLIAITELKTNFCTFDLLVVKFHYQSFLL